MARNTVSQQLSDVDLRKVVSSRSSKLEEAKTWAKENDYDWDGNDSEVVNESLEGCYSS